jgi:hemerythrin superfamily protein
MNAIEILRAEHEEILRLIEEIQTTEDPAILNDLKSILAAHTHAEEQVFYPALENFDDAKRLVSDAYHEHRLVDRALAQVDLSGTTEENRNRLQALKKRVEQHILTEERRMFTRAEELFGQSLLNELADKMKRISQERGSLTASPKPPGLPASNCVQ